MALATSKVTAQGQISIPAAVRRKLGLEPGSTIEWAEEEGKVVVRRTGKYTLQDIRRALFPDGPPPRKTLAEIEEGPARYVREQHARGRY